MPVTKEELVARRESKDVYEQRRVESLLHDVEQTGQVRPSYPYPVQVL